MYSEKFSKEYFNILHLVNAKLTYGKKLFTQDELAQLLKVSKPTINQFLQGKIIRIDLLEQVGAMVGFEIKIVCYEQNGGK